MARFGRLSEGRFAGLLGIEITAVTDEQVFSRLRLRPIHLSSNDRVHAGVIVSLADSTCGYGCRTHLPDAASGFTTIELNANFLMATQVGELTCEAQLQHSGRTTQIWDAEVRDEEQRLVALFRCTQLLLQPKES